MAAASHLDMQLVPSKHVSPAHSQNTTSMLELGPHEQAPVKQVFG